MPALPKPADKRVHRGKVSGPEFRAVQSNPAQQPDLPDRDRPWSPMTLEFWRSLGEAPVSEEFSDAEWRILMLAAFAYDETNPLHVALVFVGVAGTCVLVGPLIERTKGAWKTALALGQKEPRPVPGT